MSCNQFPSVPCEKSDVSVQICWSTPKLTSIFSIHSAARNVTRTKNSIQCHSALAFAHHRNADRSLWRCSSLHESFVRRKSSTPSALWLTSTSCRRPRKSVNLDWFINRRSSASLALSTRSASFQSPRSCTANGLCQTLASFASHAA